MTTFKLLCAATMLLAVSAPAFANPTCARYQDLMQVLSGRYQEKISAYGLSKQKNKVEIFVSKAGTFTILMTRADGISCIIAVGDNWELDLKNLTSL
jgi:hypothetical protein